MHRLSVPGKDFIYLENGKDHHCTNPRSRRPNTSSHCVLVSESPRKTQSSQALDEVTLLTQTRGRSRSASKMPIVLNVNKCLLVANAGQFTYGLHLLLTHIGKATYGKTTFPPHGDSYSSGDRQAPYDKHPQAEQRCAQKVC